MNQQRRCSQGKERIGRCVQNWESQIPSEEERCIEESFHEFASAWTLRSSNNSGVNPGSKGICLGRGFKAIYEEIWKEEVSRGEANLPCKVVTGASKRPATSSPQKASGKEDKA